MQHELERIQIIMRKATQACARGSNALQHARMDQAVGEDEVALLGQTAKHGGVGREAGIHHEPMLITLPRGERVLKLLVHHGVARDQR